MKKKPIYLYVLLVISGALTLWGVFSQFTTKPDSVLAVIKESYQKQNIPNAQTEELMKVFRKTIEFNLNTVHKAFVVVGLVLLLITLFLLLKKQVLQANLSYLAYLLLKVVLGIYGFVGSTSIARSVYAGNQDMIDASIQGSRVTLIVTVVVYLIPIILVFYKLWQQQKAADTTEE